MANLMEMRVYQEGKLDHEMGKANFPLVQLHMTQNCSMKGYRVYNWFVDKHPLDEDMPPHHWERNQEKADVDLAAEKQFLTTMYEMYYNKTTNAWELVGCIEDWDEALLMAVNAITGGAVKGVLNPRP